MSKAWANAAYFLAVIIFSATFLIIFMPQSAWPSLVAGTAALMIAFVAYPWQKARDRELKIAEEKRSAYREFFYAAEEFRSLYQTSPGGEINDDIRTARSRLDASKSGLALLASSKGLNECEKLYESLLHFQYCSKDFRGALKRVMAGLERDESETDDDWTRRIFKGTIGGAEGVAWSSASAEISLCRMGSVLAARADCDLENRDADLEASIGSLFDFPRSRKRGEFVEEQVSQ